MWNKLGLLIQILIVIAGVIIFARFDPFGLLVGKKATLRDTPVTVESIKEIGQLISAEYYGEVISSLQDAEEQELIREVRADAVPKTASEKARQLEKLRADFILSIRRLVVARIDVGWWPLFKAQRLQEKFEASNSELVHNKYYKDLMTVLLASAKNESGVGAYQSEKDLLWAIYKGKIRIDQVERDLKLLKADSLVAKIDTIRVARANYLPSQKSFQKRQIVVVGRGWVRAGIDFGTFTEKNFKYDPVTGTVHLFDIEPQILNCDINPWFVPKDKIKGFEILMSTRQANSPEYLNRVKEHCKNELRDAAIKAEILQQAKVNAEESLKHFFSLLIPNGVKKVIISSYSLDSYKTFLFTHGRLRPERLPSVDSTLIALDTIDVDIRRALAQTLDTVKLDENSGLSPVHRYSSLLFEICRDSILKNDERMQLLSAINAATFSKLDSMWFLPDGISDTIKNRTRRELKNLLYGHWYSSFTLDSVAQRDTYMNYARQFDEKNSLYHNQEMSARRSRAIAQSAEYLKQRLFTVYLKEDSATHDLHGVPKAVDAVLGITAGKPPTDNK